MPILAPETPVGRATENAVLRTETACMKLTPEEFRSVQEISVASGMTRGEWMREVVLEAVRLEREGLRQNLALGEIVGVQLLLMNVLKPIATGQTLTAPAFDKIVAEVHKTKKSVARRLLKEGK
jgi:hypothetical protein